MHINFDCHQRAIPVNSINKKLIGFFFGSAEAEWSDFGQTNDPKKIYEILCWPKELNSRNKVFGIHKTANLLSFYFACSP